ncbi:hypothetical protein GCM10009734_45680 [Nonomuraea bangladeshensis]
MGPSFTHDQILDAARDAAFEHWRSATIGHVTALLGAPSGSIYHERRYGRITPHGLEVIALACRDSPYGIVRPLIGEPIPAWIDDAVRVTSTALAHLND